jgi:aminomethyltransferase
MRAVQATVGAMSAPEPDQPLLHSPLHAEHVALGATMGAFGGWDMPISYAGAGVVAEHTAVRTAVGIFDVSHLGKASVTGPGAAAFVNDCLTADLAKITPGQAQYTMCCNESGGVIDDLIAYLVSDDEVFLIPNAANTAAVVAALAAAAPEGVEVANRHTDFAVLAVQGPASDDVMGALGLPSDLQYMSWVDAEFEGRPVRVCRTGYTGERGYELVPGWPDAPVVWEALVHEAGLRGGRPAGLGARDTLRTEMGYALHGQDLSPEITPVQARVGWAVGWRKPSFFGRTALLTEREEGPVRASWGLLALDRGVLRGHLGVLDAEGVRIGETTSGTFSPTLGQGIGLALIDTISEVAENDEIAVDVRGRRLRVRVVKPPFVPAHVR